LEVFKDGFETLNTRYKAVKEGEVERQPKYDGYGAGADIGHLILGSKLPDVL
jgi:hypothetical protein